jgi:hypothetical protein
MEDPILTKAELAKRQKRSLESITTACSRNPASVPPFFKLGNNKNSPIRFRLSVVIAWEAEMEEQQSKVAASVSQKMNPKWDVR